ncbi:GTPase SLIP-GC protein, partial [Rhizoctonia solani AG-3 Rhs1AP]
MPPEDSQSTFVVKAEPREPAPLTLPSSAVYPPQPYPPQEHQAPLLSYPHSSPPEVQLPLPSPRPSTQASPVVVKPEPVDGQHIASGPSQSNIASQSSSNVRAPDPPQTTSPIRVKPESETQHEPPSMLETQPQIDVKPEIPMARPHTTYTSAKEINYTPESALATCAQTATAIENYLKELDLGDLRKNIWFRDIESFKNQATPRTMIAVCGATGAGKSSLLNAVLDDNVVPTSGMRACTAVVTEIGYHDKDSISAEVGFLARPEWKSELEILLDDLVEENGKLKRLSDLRTDAGVAWAKIHAVYSQLTAERMITMTPDEIIDSKPEIARILGTTEYIDRPDSEEFSSAIAKYVDSKDQKRGRDKPKKSAGDRPKGNESALWPLIRLVRVWTKAQALSGGAVLVDLPGVADANLARSSIAKEYMKDAIASGLQHQSLDGNYDASFITFIATKTDDLSCTEVIGALGLYDNPELVEIEAKLDVEQAELEDWTIKSKAAAEELREMAAEIKELKPILTEYKDHLKALKAGAPFRPILTAPETPGGGSPKKRKRGSGGRKAKRARIDSDDDFSEAGSMDLDDDDFIDDHNETEEVNTEAEDALVEEVLDQDIIEIDSDSDEVIVLTDSDDLDDQPKAKVTPKATPVPSAQERIKNSIQETEARIRELRQRTEELKDTRKEAESNANSHKKAASKYQKEKNAFCAKKRNEYSKDVLKEDFRQGLKQLDQADEEAKNPETFDPSVELRDYNAIDLPVFTCSSRDYIRIKKQVKGDGGPSCFTNPEDTEVPALQEWCHQLTLSSRERSARNLLHNLTTFLHSIKSYVDKMEGVNVGDRQVLAKLWESTVHMVQIDDSLGLTQAQPNPPPAPPAPPVSPYMRRGYRRNESFQPPADTSLNGTAERAKRILAKARYALPPDGKGISFRLRQNMKTIAANCVEQLENAFREGIEERCLSGAMKARQSAVEISDNFASSMHWQSYRAALRRNGEWKGDLNADLVGPMTREIAASWARVFDSDLFAPTVRAERQEITNLLKEVQASAPPDLSARCEAQSQLALKEAEVLTTNLLRNLKTLMTSEQKDISRCLTPHVQRELSAAYQSASAERGTGSVARQKKLFHNYVEASRGTIFSKGTETLFKKLDQAAELTGVLLELGLSELAEKVEVNMSVLWDIPKASNAEARKRRNLIQHINDMLHQLGLWLAASKANGVANNDAGEPMVDGLTGICRSEGSTQIDTTGHIVPSENYAMGTDVERMDEDEDEDAGAGVDEDEEDEFGEEDEDEFGEEDEDEVGEEDVDGESDGEGGYYGMYY